jgi:hypothetical protein
MSQEPEELLAMVLGIQATVTEKFGNVAVRFQAWELIHFMLVARQYALRADPRGDAERDRDFLVGSLEGVGEKGERAEQIRSIYATIIKSLENGWHQRQET